MAEKKNVDYSASAVNLTNHEQLVDMLRVLHEKQTEMESLRVKIQAAVPQELRDREAFLTQDIGEIMGDIRLTIDERGSCQDVERGWYAVKQRRESIAYKPELVRQYAPSKVASFVLIESVDTKAMDAMLKTGQITPEQVKQCGEVKETFAYIIK